MKKRIKMGTNVISFTLIVFILWIMVNYLNARHYYRFDLTSSHQFSLSEKTKKILKNLEKPLSITTLYRPGTFLFRQVKDILEEYATHSSMIKVEHIDAERERGEVELLAKRLKVGSFRLNTVIFECEGRSKQVPQSEVEEYDYRSHYGQPSPPKFKGEEAFTSAILSVTEEKQTIIYFVSGHGEKHLENFQYDGLSTLSDILKRENIKVKKVFLGKEEKIPEDCHLLVICGPTKKFLTKEREILDKYLTEGGKSFIMIDPLIFAGLGTLLEKWGVKLANNVIIDPSGRLPFIGPTTLFITDYPYHPITNAMKSLATIFSLARSVELASKERIQQASLVKTSQESWGETNLKVKKAVFDKEEDKKGPLSIGVAISEEEKGTRLVIFGDSDFVSNAQINNMGNSDLFLNAVNWLVKKEKLISIGPKRLDIRKVVLSEKKMKEIFWFTVAGLPGIVLLIGGLVWWRRRK